MSTEKQSGFRYTYSAKEQEEVKAIRKKYESSPETEDAMTKLRRLDATVTHKATTVALVIGIIGALIMGCGMSFLMTDLGDILAMKPIPVMVIGVILGVVGMILVAFAYPTYSVIIKKERKKIAPEILRLTDELMK